MNQFCRNLGLSETVENREKIEAEIELFTVPILGTFLLIA